MMEGIPLAGGDRPMEGQGHDEDQAIDAVGVADLRVLQTEAPRLEVGKHRLNAPALAVFQGFQVAGRLGHGDDPGFAMARIMDDGDVGPGRFGGELDIPEREDPLLRTGAGRRPAGPLEHDKVALQAQAVAPPVPGTS